MKISSLNLIRYYVYRGLNSIDLLKQDIGFLQIKSWWLQLLTHHRHLWSLAILDFENFDKVNNYSSVIVQNKRVMCYGCMQRFQGPYRNGSSHQKYFHLDISARELRKIRHQINIPYLVKMHINYFFPRKGKVVMLPLDKQFLQNMWNNLQSRLPDWQDRIPCWRLGTWRALVL